jgi:flagellar protein FliT
VDAAKSIWWYVMSSVLELLELTKEIEKKAKVLSGTMENNEPEQLEELGALIEKREPIINELDKKLKEENHRFTEEEKRAISELKELEAVLSPLLTKLYQSFSLQMSRFKQGKKVSQKYNNPYASTYTDGAFFDKRK